MTEIEPSARAAGAGAGRVDVRAGARVARRRHARRALRALRRRRVGRAALRRDFTTISPATRSRWRGRAGRARGRRARGRGRARGVRRRGRSCPAPSARSTSSGSRASSQERSREFAVLESLNGGKPIKESRDVDLPLAAAHFFYYAGWADKLEYAFPNRTPQPLGVAGQIIPWNFPLLMLAWKIAPALATGNTVVLKPAETTPLTALLFCDVLRQAELPPGVVNIVTGDGRAGAALVDAEVDKIAFTGLDRGRQGDPAPARGHRQEADARARRQGREHHLRRRRARPGGRGDRQRDLLQPGPRVLRRLAAVRPGVDRRAADRQAEAAHGDAARRRPARQEHRRRRDQLEAQLEKIEELVAAGEDEGAEIYQPPCRLPEKGYWFAPTVFTNVAQSYRIAQEEIFGPVLSVLTFRTPDEAVEKANNTPYGLCAASGRRRARGSSGWPSGCAPASSGRTRTTASIPRARSAATRSRGFGREGGLHGLEPYLDSRCESSAMTDRLATSSRCPYERALRRRPRVPRRA